MRRFQKEDFIFERKIGSGGCSQVWRVKHIESQKIYAMKMVNTWSVMEKLWRREIDISRKVTRLDHDNLLKYEGFFHHGQTLYLIMEYIAHLDLGQCVANGHKFSPRMVAHIIFQTVDAILTLRKEGIMYRDLKPDNIIFDPCAHDRYRVKLCDFSHSVICRTDRRATQTGTPCYVSPEIAQGRYYGVNAANIYPLGVICHELLTGKLPFKDTEKNEDLLFQIKYGKLDLQVKELPDVCQKFIKDVLVRRRPKRLELVLDHPYIQKYCSTTRKSDFLPQITNRLAKRKRFDESSFKTPKKKKRKLD